MEEKKYLSRTECAKMLGVHRQTVSNYINEGLLGGAIVNGQFKISYESAQDFMENHIEEIECEKDLIVRYKKKLKSERMKLEEKLQNARHDYSSVEYRELGKVVRHMLISVCEAMGIDISHRNWKILCDYLDGHSMSEIAEMNYLTRERVRQIINYIRSVFPRKVEETKNRINEIEIEQRGRLARQRLHIRDLKLRLDLTSKEKYQFDGWAPPTVSREILNIRLQEAKLSVRAKNCLHRADILTVGELIQFSDVGLRGIRCFGRKTLEEIKEFLKGYNLSLRS